MEINLRFEIYGLLFAYTDKNDIFFEVFPPKSKNIHHKSLLILLFGVQISYFWRLPSILPNKTQELVLISFKTNSNVCMHQNVFHDAFEIKINPI